MKAFMDENFLLTSGTAERLYAFCAHLPIVDYHCHVSPKEIYEDKKFENITQAWLYGDHYKWRLMRSNGVEERYITGEAGDKEKFLAFAATLPKAIGNPLYHWCHLELKKYFGYNGVLSEKTAEEVWELTLEKLKDENMGVRGLIEQSNVAFIGTTDDPADSLEWHEKLALDKSMKTVVAPSFRPDKALHIEKAGWKEYIAKLSSVSGVTIDGMDALKRALSRRIDYFAAHGCKASDHGLDYFVFEESEEGETDEIVKKGLAGTRITQEEGDKVKTELLLFCAGEYVRAEFVMQLHFNCLRNPNTKMLQKLGADTGFDVIGPHNGSAALCKFLDRANETGLPRTVLYSLDSGDNAFLDSVIGAFQSSEIAGKLQHGSAWWFNDNKQGMREQMISLANLGVLGNFIGMLTDSRSFLSYTRHEYFRRILCSLIGEWVENGEYPDDSEQLRSLVGDICYHNAKRYFNLEEK